MAKLIADCPGAGRKFEAITPMIVEREVQVADETRETLRVEYDKALAAISALDKTIAEYEQMRTKASGFTEQRHSRKEGATLMRDLETKLVTCQDDRKELMESLTEYKRLVARANLRVTLVREIVSCVAKGDTDKTRALVDKLNKVMPSQ